MAGWGLLPVSKGAEDKFSSKLSEEKGKGASPVAAQAAFLQPAEALDGPVPISGPAWPPPSPAQIASPVREQGKRSILPLLLAALLSFLLFFVLAVLLLPGLRDALLVYGMDPLASYGALDDEERRLKGELALLKKNYHGALYACKPEGDAGEEPSDGLSGFGIPEIQDEGEHAEIKPEEPQSVLVAKADPPPQVPKIQDSSLIIPENPSDLSFLEGCWQNDSGMVNSDTLLPVIYIYCFDKNGNAKIHLDEKNASGIVTETCRTTGKASLSGAKLTIRDNGVVCSRGRSYHRHIIDCARGQGGRASCVVSQEGGTIPPYSARFKYMGKNSG
jgi:hypothetical protein